MKTKYNRGDGDVKQEIRNSRALAVYSRVQKKLTGTAVLVTYRASADAMV